MKFTNIYIYIYLYTYELQNDEKSKQEKSVCLIDIKHSIHKLEHRNTKTTQTAKHYNTKKTRQFDIKTPEVHANYDFKSR